MGRIPSRPPDIVTKMETLIYKKEDERRKMEEFGTVRTSVVKILRGGRGR